MATTTATTTKTISSPSIPIITLKPYASQSQSPLLRLPAELRNEIYTLLLTSSEIPALQHKAARCVSYSSSTSLPRADIHPAILATCRQIRDEATPILYARNTFAAHASLLTKLPFLVQPSHPITSKDAVRQIRNWRLSVRLDIDARFTGADLAAAFNNCDSLEIEVWQAQFEACDYSVLRLFEEIRGVRRARVTGSVEPGFAHWLELVMMSPVETDDEKAGSGASTPAYVEFDGEDGRRTAMGPGGLNLWVHGRRW